MDLHKASVLFVAFLIEPRRLLNNFLQLLEQAFLFVHALSQVTLVQVGFRSLIDLAFGSHVGEVAFYGSLAAFEA